jgi:hypothetical protein
LGGRGVDSRMTAARTMLAYVSVKSRINVSELRHAI